MTEEEIRMCSTRSALSEMLEAASRRLERTLRGAPTGGHGKPPISLEEARNAVADLTARLATHRSAHGC